MATFINARFLTQPLTGVQRFSLEISKQLNLIRNDLIFLVHCKNEIIDQSLLNLFNIQEIKGGKGHYWEQVTLPCYLNSIGKPLLINLANTAPIFYINKISTLHDIIFIKYPKSYSWKFRSFYKILIPLILKTSKKVITVSNYSKEDICNYYKVDSKTINVVYNSYSEIFYSDRLIEKKNYALAVSSPNLHKNFNSMIDAFLSSKINLDLKIIGSLSNVFDSPKYSSDERIDFLGRVSDKELVELYKNAKFFIFPSLYEGFGIPPLEAQACGCPVVSSNASSLPEVLSQSAYFFDPLNLKSISDALVKIDSDGELREELIQKGFINIQRFSWTKSATQLNEILLSNNSYED